MTTSRTGKEPATSPQPLVLARQNQSHEWHGIKVPIRLGRMQFPCHLGRVRGGLRGTPSAPPVARYNSEEVAK